MTAHREHWMGDEIVDLCWADKEPFPTAQKPCNRTNVISPIGLCPMHYQEIVGDLPDEGQVAA